MLLAVAIVVAVGVTATKSRAPRAGGLVADAAVTVSSTDGQSSSSALVDTGSATDPGAEWVAAKPGVGSWVQLTWNHPVELNNLVLVASSDPSRQVSAGFLRFSDNSAVQVPAMTDRQATAVAFAPRSVTSLRFTVSTLELGIGDGRLGRADPGGDYRTRCGGRRPAG